MSADANFAETLAARAAAHPELTALIEPVHSLAGHPQWRRISYRALDSLANRYAHGLARQGIHWGDRALFLLPPSIDTYAAFYALLRLGAVPVLIDPRMGLRRLLSCLEEVAARVVLTIPIVRALRVFLRQPFAAAEVVITAGSGGLSRVLAESTRHLDGLPALEPTGLEDPAILPFTSGATGAPKGVFYTHGMMRQQTEVTRRICGWGEAMSVVMCYAPFVPYALADGLTVILPDVDFTRPAAIPPARVVDAVRSHGAQCAFASPIVWIRLARHCERRGHTLPTLERVVTAGAPVPIDLHRRLLPFLHPEAQLYTPYGATEAMPLTTAGSRELAGTWARSAGGYGTCVGRPLPGVALRIIRVTDEVIPVWADDLSVPGGTIGEIVVESALVSPEYPNRPEETARAKIRRNGRVLHRTGDLGRLDPDARLWFCGRKAHRIETSSGMLAADPIETILNLHPAVFRSALVGIGPAGSQIPVACVELEPGLALSPRLETELLRCADGTCFEGAVTRILPHRGFPVDARHNAKIRREELACWAARKLGKR